MRLRFWIRTGLQTFLWVVGACALYSFLMFIQHAAAWLSLIRKRSHFSFMQIFIAASHRGAKAQPLGMFSRSIGVPLIGWSL